MDWWNETAKRCHDKPDGWMWYRVDADAPEGFVEVEGAVPIGEYKRGPRKGRPKWGPRKDGERIWMKESDVEETKRLWAEQIGQCPKCTGSGKVVKSVSVHDGTKYRECSECAGSGKYREAASA